jgi:hypothetical protein
MEFQEFPPLFAKKERKVYEPTLKGGYRVGCRQSDHLGPDFEEFLSFSALLNGNHR